MLEKGRKRWVFVILREANPLTTKKTEIAETPLMKQYLAIKGKYPDALLLFRVGDFYETFGQDAIKAAGILGIVLTKRANGSASHVELAGFPHHSLETYLPKLVRAGQRVAICDQLEDPKATKTIVKRGVTELVTPGVTFNDKVLDHKSNNFLAAIQIGPRNCGAAFCDVSTGEFLAAEGSWEYIEKLIQGFRPSEILFNKAAKKVVTEKLDERMYLYGLDEWIFQQDFCSELLLRHFGTSTLKGFGIEDLSMAVVAAGAVLHYVSETRQEKLRHITAISRIEEDHYVWLDRFTIRNLELFSSNSDNARNLFDVLDHTVTPMGGRMLKRWMALPLKDKAPIEDRLSIVEFFLNNAEAAGILNTQLSTVGDLERLISKVSVNRINPREVLQLKRALSAVVVLKNLCLSSGNKQLKDLSEKLDPCSAIRERIDSEIVSDPPALSQKGGVIAEGINAELDDLRSIAYSGKDYLVQLQQREIARTGITSLKIGYNNVFGYYLEVTHSHKDKVPQDWIRKQTLVNAERYITPELKEYEEKILGAEEKIYAIEQRLYLELVTALGEYILPIQLNATLLAKLDCLLSFANCAKKNGYVKPALNDGYELEIHQGRHPVIEQNLPLGESYVANDVFLDNEKQQIIIITGPNMSGKSAILRQTALIVLMAQMGSYVPAKYASIGIIDKIFTRVGASDNISSGESTFMVEMNETASILNNISDRSLVILDEIGRGTSTYDGISIAWAIAEFLHEHKGRPKTLFATHYHELNEMTEVMKRIRNFNVSVKETGNKVLFLRKLVEGGSEHSFGIHVARMAGMPRKVLDRANSVLKSLEQKHGSDLNGKPDFKAASNEMQLSFFQLDDPVLEQIKDELVKTDINTLTPVEALMKLNEIKKLIGG